MGRVLDKSSTSDNDFKQLFINADKSCYAAACLFVLLPLVPLLVQTFFGLLCVLIPASVSVSFKALVSVMVDLSAFRSSLVSHSDLFLFLPFFCSGYFFPVPSILLPNHPNPDLFGDWRPYFLDCFI